jgi:hypothetical protein
MQLLLKCADLGNVVRPLETADAWGKRIMEEFYQQGGAVQVESSSVVTHGLKAPGLTTLEPDMCV